MGLERLKEIKGFVEIELYDGKHELLYSQNALKVIQKELKCKLDELEDVLNDDGNLVENLQILLLAGLQHETIRKREKRYTIEDIEYFTLDISLDYMLNKIMVGLEKLGEMMNTNTPDTNQPTT